MFSNIIYFLFWKHMDSVNVGIKWFSMKKNLGEKLEKLDEIWL